MNPKEVVRPLAQGPTTAKRWSQMPWELLWGLLEPLFPAESPWVYLPVAHTSLGYSLELDPWG